MPSSRGGGAPPPAPPPHMLPHTKKKPADTHPGRSWRPRGHCSTLAPAPLDSFRRPSPPPPKQGVRMLLRPAITLLLRLRALLSAARHAAPLAPNCARRVRRAVRLPPHLPRRGLAPFRAPAATHPYACGPLLFSAPPAPLGGAPPQARSPRSKPARAQHGHPTTHPRTARPDRGQPAPSPLPRRTHTLLIAPNRRACGCVQATVHPVDCPSPPAPACATYLATRALITPLCNPCSSLTPCVTGASS